jgi:stage II sporulation protein AA (anti-sigma F factor antagonist)
MDELTPDNERELEVEVGADEHGTPIVSVRGELDLDTVEQLDDAVAPVLAKDPHALILDLSEVGFADSSAIGKLVQWSTNVGDLQVRGASPLLRRVITTMGLGRTLRLT